MEYSDANRGKIQNKKLALQVKDYSNLKFGEITPTDIDGFMDFQNQCFVYIEVKHIEAKMPSGQRLALERLCDATNKAGIKSTVLVCVHDTENDIDVGNCIVSECYFGKKWWPNKSNLSANQMAERFKDGK